MSSGSQVGLTINPCFLSAESFLMFVPFQEYLDKAFAWYQGMTVYPLIPNSEGGELEEEEEGVELTPNQKIPGKKSKDENKPDAEVARYDVVKVNIQSHTSQEP